MMDTCCRCLQKFGLTCTNIKAVHRTKPCREHEHHDRLPKDYRLKQDVRETVSECLII